MSNCDDAGTGSCATATLAMARRLKSRTVAKRKHVFVLLLFMNHSCRLCVFGPLCGFNFWPLPTKALSQKRSFNRKIPWATLKTSVSMRHAWIVSNPVILAFCVGQSLIGAKESRRAPEVTATSLFWKVEMNGLFAPGPCPYDWINPFRIA
jgi:hypothetical protein